MKGFLYGQTEYNLMNNTIHLNDYIRRAKEEGFTFVSLTDRNLYGCYKFYQACKKEQMKPLIGLEITYLDEDQSESKMLAYAKTNLGYRNLLKITTFLNTNPQPMGLDFLNAYKADIAFVMVYNESILERYYFSNAFDLLTEKIKFFQKHFDFYVGYSFKNRLDLLKSNQEFLKYCEKYQVKTVPIHNCRYLKNDDIKIYEALTQIGGEPVTVHDYEDYSFDINPLITKELEVFVDSIRLDLFPNTFYLPTYPNTKGVSAVEYLKALCYKGLEKRLNGKTNNQYVQRLNYELQVIDKMGYSDYFLIVWDFILFAKKKDILVGPGRGSAAGSLVAYCLGITEIDPLKYDLLFERFLNPERISMPDIDTDFPDTKRDEVIKYVQELYGAKHVSSISAYNTFLIKSSIRDLGRILKMDNLRLEEMIHLVEESKSYDELLEQFKDREEVYDFLYIVRGLEGLPRHISTHAAGIIISSCPLDDLVPLQEGLNGLYQSEFEASDLEKIGLLKMDFLGIRNLTIIEDVIKQIPKFDMSKLRRIPLNDPNTLRLLQNADTLGVFQLESAGIRRVLSNLHCESFEDLVAVLALYRPGPMDNIDEFIARKHGKKFTYPHPVLEPILKITYGIIVYQEQIMMIAQRFANFSLGQADLLRRAISKKKESELQKLRQCFIEGAKKNGYSIVVAENIYEYILKFANYGFNKSHSVAYGLLAYQMAYLKANYFNIFISKILNNVIGSTKTMEEYIQYAKTRGVETCKPSINISTTIFEVRDKKMFMPLDAIHSIGVSIAKEIVEERNAHGPYKSFQEFKERTNLNASILEALIYAGALDDFKITKKQMINSKESYNEIFSRHLEDRIEDTSEFDFGFLKEKEQVYLGFNLTYNLFTDLPNLQRKYHTSYLSNQNNRSIVSFEQAKEILTKKQEAMLVGKVNDHRQVVDFVIFPLEYQSLKINIDRNHLYVVDYKMEVDKKTNQNKIIIRNVMQV